MSEQQKKEKKKEALILFKNFLISQRAFSIKDYKEAMRGLDKYLLRVARFVELKRKEEAEITWILYSDSERHFRSNFSPTIEDKFYLNFKEIDIKKLAKLHLKSFEVPSLAIQIENYFDEETISEGKNTYAKWIKRISSSSNFLKQYDKIYLVGNFDAIKNEFLTNILRFLLHVPTKIVFVPELLTHDTGPLTPQRLLEKLESFLDFPKFGFGHVDQESILGKFEITNFSDILKTKDLHPLSPEQYFERTKELRLKTVELRPEIVEPKIKDVVEALDSYDFLVSHASCQGHLEKLPNQSDVFSTPYVQFYALDEKAKKFIKSVKKIEKKYEIGIKLTQTYYSGIGDYLLSFSTMDEHGNTTDEYVYQNIARFVDKIERVVFATKLWRLLPFKLRKRSKRNQD